MSDSASVQAILGNTGQAPPNPLVTLQNWQSLSNSAVQQAEGQQSISNMQTQQQVAQQGLVELRNNFLGGMVYAQHLTGGDTAAGYDHVFDTALSLGADPNIVNTLKSNFDNAPSDAARAQLANATGLRLVNPQIAQHMAGTEGFITAGARNYPSVTPGVGFPGQGQPQFGAAGTPPAQPGGGYLTPSSIDRTTGPPDPNTGAPTTVPQVSTLPPSMGGVGPSAPGGGYSHNNAPPIAGVPGATAQPSIGGASAQPTASQAAPAQPTQTTQSMPGQMPTGMPPQFETSRQMGNTLVAQAQNVTQNKSDYGNLLTELNNIQTGPSTNKQEALGAFLQKWGGSPWLAGMTTNTLADTESFNKISQTIANRQAGLLSGSNQSQSSAISATPNLSISTPGNVQIIHKLQGNEDAIGAKADAWNGWSAKNGQGSYNQFSTWWNNNVDVRAFQGQYMSPEERNAMGNGIAKQSPNALAQFKAKAQLVQQAQSNPDPTTGWMSVEPSLSGQ